MTPLTQTDNKLRYQLGQEMARVDTLRLQLDMRNPHVTWPEFWMRRALLRSKLALQQHNMIEVQRMYKVLMQIGHDRS
jgi:hypothetical protein